MKKRLVFTFVMILGILFLQSTFSIAQKLDVKVDGNRILETISHMASDKQMGRKPNTPEFFALQDWVVKQYKTWGLEPAGENGQR